MNNQVPEHWERLVKEVFEDMWELGSVQTQQMMNTSRLVFTVPHSFTLVLSGLGGALEHASLTIVVQTDSGVKKDICETDINSEDELPNILSWFWTKVREHYPE